MSLYPHARGLPQSGARLQELLDQIRSEFENQIRINEGYEQQKVQQQVQEASLIRDKVYQLEQAHMSIKQKYEEEISLLRRQLEAARGGAPPQPGMPGPQHGGPSAPPPSIGVGNNLFGGIMTGQGGQGAGPPPPPPPPSQAPPFQPGYGQGPGPNGFPGQAPQTTASPGPGKRGIGRPPAGGPATPQINTPLPYAGPGASPQVPNHPTPDHRVVHPPPSAMVNNALGELDPDRVPAHVKKTRDDWFVIFNQHVPRVLDVDLVHTLSHESVVCCVRFSHDGKYVATGCNRSAQIYDVSSGEKVCVLQDENVDVTGDLYIRSVCFSPDGKYLATGAEDKLIRVWDIANRTIRNTFAGHEQDIYSLDFARDGRTIASGSGDRTVRLWDIESSSNILTLTIEDGVTTVAISPDTKYVAAGSLDKSVRVWDIHQGYLLERLEGPEGHKDSVYSVAFSPSGKELDFVLSVALTPDASWVMSGSKDRGVQFWDPRTGYTQLMLQGHKNSVISVAPSPTGGFFATGSGDMRARIWSYRTLAQ
ncbi:hypothetical protein CIB48_g9706 [Xylaria polymorpha]|nr:hypothetical protein CIB48_g9706 [Xylaria polymorpha]